MTTLLGMVLGHLWLNPVIEPLAVRYLYPKVDRRAPLPRVRFVDLGHLYGIAGDADGHLPPELLIKLLREAERLPADRRPAAIGTDVFLPFLQDSTGTNRSISNAPSGKALLAEARRLDGVLTVRFGVSFFKNPIASRRIPGTSPTGAEADELWLAGHLATTFLFHRLDVAPKWFGDENAGPVLPSLGVALAREALRSPTRFEGRSPAAGPRHLIRPPAEWPQGLLPATEWMWVDYAVLSQRERLTVVAGEHIEAKEDLESADLLDSAALEKLAPTDGEPTVWLVGRADLSDAEDTFTYDEESHAVGEAIPLRRIYQHGAIAHTYRDAPLQRPEQWTLGPLPIAELGLDLLPALLGLILTNLIHGRRSDWKPWVWAIARFGVVVAVMLFALGLSFGLALLLRIFWLGYLGAACYVLVEFFLATVTEEGMPDHNSHALRPEIERKLPESDSIVGQGAASPAPIER